MIIFLTFTRRTVTWQLLYLLHIHIHSARTNLWAASSLSSQDHKTLRAWFSEGLRTCSFYWRQWELWVLSTSENEAQDVHSTQPPNTETKAVSEGEKKYIYAKPKSNSLLASAGRPNNCKMEKTGGFFITQGSPVFVDILVDMLNPNGHVATTQNTPLWFLLISTPAFSPPCLLAV